MPWDPGHSTLPRQQHSHGQDLRPSPLQRHRDGDTRPPWEPLMAPGLGYGVGAMGQGLRVHSSSLVPSAGQSAAREEDGHAV